MGETASGGGRGRFAALAAAVLSAALVAGLATAVVRVVSMEAGSGGAGEAGSMTAVEKRAVASEALERGRSLLRGNEAGRAVALLEETIRAVPNDAGLWMLLADARFSVGDAAGAYEAMDRGVTLSVDDAAEYRFSAAMYALEAGEREAARTHLTRAQHLEPSAAKYPLYLAMIEQRDGMADDARLHAARAVKLDPSAHEGWGILAQLAFDEGRLEAARGYIDRASRIAPGQVGYAVLESRILRRENRPEDAAAVLLGLDEGVRLGNPAIAHDLAVCYLMLGRRGDAAGVYAAAARRNPEDASSALEAARLYMELGDRERALGFAQVAAARGSDEAAGVLSELRSGG